MKVARENAMRGRIQAYEDLGAAYERTVAKAPTQGGTVYASRKAHEAYCAAKDIRQQLDGE